jgi:hypothetical protein
MKSICLFLCLLMLPFLLSAQEIGKEAVVAVTNLNILYMGVSNPIEIAVPGVRSDNVTATLTNGTIIKTTTGWEVKPSSVSDVVLTVLVDNKKVTEKTFRVKPISSPVAVIGGKFNSVLSKSDVLKAGVLEAELKDFLWDQKFEIKSFTLLYSKDGFDNEITSDGDKVTDEMKSIISNLKSGAFFIFKDIKAIGPDKQIVNLDPIAIKIY